MVESLLAIASRDGEKKYSPPRETTKSVVKEILCVGLLGFKPATLRDEPLFAPIIGSNPGCTFFPKTKPG